MDLAKLLELLLGLMDSSRELTSIYVMGFIINLYLFLIGVQTFDATGLNLVL
jgi:hypothetical protein